MMVQTTSLDEQIASLTAVVGNLLKHVQARDDQLNKLHNKFQSAPASNEFEEQDLSVECNTSKGISVSTNGFVSVEHVKNTVNEAIAKTYETRVQAFKSYVKPYTRRIEQLRMLENYQPPKFQQFNGHGDPRQHIAHFVETCNDAGTDGDLLVKQFVLSLKDTAFDCRVMHSRHALGTMLHSSSNKTKTFGELATRAHGIEMSFNCKEDEYLVDASEDDGDYDDATP
ncbi:UNVERIFIED_CONTAM: hypothetical protein Sradi_1524400 [Sesamum radiatum]|uniref:Retrotransposon gag protein n=1 Tax=Sesamum radiatum TaxID=300843 RepID=A0AAW2U9B3_SESRA